MTQPFVLKPSRIPSPDYPREPKSAVASGADHQLFARLMTQGRSGISSGALGASPSADAGLIRAVSDQLLSRFEGGGQWPLQCVIELARRGRIYVSARYERRVWAISLEAEHAATAQWLVEQQPACEQSLTRALGQPVRVQLLPERLA